MRKLCVNYAYFGVLLKTFYLPFHKETQIFVISNINQHNKQYHASSSNVVIHKLKSLKNIIKIQKLQGIFAYQLLLTLIQYMFLLKHFFSLPVGTFPCKIK